MSDKATSLNIVRIKESQVGSVEYFTEQIGGAKAAILLLLTKNGKLVIKSNLEEDVVVSLIERALDRLVPVESAD